MEVWNVLIKYLQTDATFVCSTLLHRCRFICILCPSASAKNGDDFWTNCCLFEWIRLYERKWILADDHSCPTTQAHSFKTHQSRFQLPMRQVSRLGLGSIAG